MIMLAHIVLVPVLIAMLVNDGLAAQSSDFTFAAIQYSPTPGAPGRNRERLIQMVRKAVQNGARNIVLPELAVTGPLRDTTFEPNSHDPRESIPGLTTRYFSDYARQLGVWMLIPVVERAKMGQGYYVTIVLLNDQGKIIHIYRKVKPRTNGTDGTHLVRGDPRVALESIEFRGHRIGVLSGDDIQQGVPRLAARGAEVILVAAGWSADEGVPWRTLCQQLSQTYKINLIVANRETRLPRRRSSILPHLGGIFLTNGRSIISNNRSSNDAVIAEVPSRPAYTLAPLPLGLPSVPLPSHYPMTEELVALGRDLFFDAHLSNSGDVSCATCHDPTMAFADGLARGVGIGGRKTKRNTPSLLNVAYRSTLGWDGASALLESQAKFPMSHVSEMGSHYLSVLESIRRNPTYARKFQRISGKGQIEFEDIAQALASYERTLLSGTSAFDKYFYAREEEAISAAAIRGLRLFTGKARCVTCHNISPHSALLTDNSFHNTGVGYSEGVFADLGRGALSDGREAGYFATPSLRNVAETAPYMHDGSLASLRDVIQYYNRGGNKNPYLDPAIHPLHLIDKEVNDLEEFLRTLTGNHAYTVTGERIPDVAQLAVLEGKSFPRVAAIQYTASERTRQENREKLTQLVRRAAQEGAKVVVLPEGAETGRLRDWCCARQSMRSSQKSVDQALLHFRRLALELNIWLIVPLFEGDSNANATFVTVVLLSNEGRVVTKHRKVLTRLAGRDRSATQGDWKHIQLVDSPLGRTGILSGDDIIYGVERLSQLGAETILVSAEWEKADGVDWIGWSVKLAKQHRVNLVISNLRENTSSEATRFGAIIEYDGKLSAREKGEEEAEIVLSPVSPARQLRGQTPSGLPPMPYPPSWDLKQQSIELGRKLFFDSHLSGDGQTSCASCHNPEKGFTDGRQVPQGVFGRLGHRNTPSVLNTAYRTFLFWDGRADSLEDQVANAVRGWAEMGTDQDAVVNYLESSPLYRTAFRQVTSRDSITFRDAARCISDYERSLVVGNSLFDRYYYMGDKTQISRPAQRGLEVFKTRGNCVSCHTFTPRYALFTDNTFHNTGVGFHKRFQYLGYGGDGLPTPFTTRDQFRGEYLTPSLRNVARTAPYMHDGSIKTLREVVEFYNRGGVPNPFQDRELKALHLTDSDKEDLVEFLQTLTSDQEFNVDGSKKSLHVSSQ